MGVPIEALISAAGITGVATIVSGWLTDRLARLARSKKDHPVGGSLRVELKTADGRSISVELDSRDIGRAGKIEAALARLVDDEASRDSRDDDEAGE